MDKDERILHGYAIGLLVILSGIAFWIAIGASSVAFLAYEQYRFENQPPQIAGTLEIPPAPPAKGESF